MDATATGASNAVLEPYVSRLTVSWLRDQPESTWREIDGSMAFVDISGFTQLTERLARQGRVGAEQMSDILNGTFANLLTIAHGEGASLVKWGGDAVLLLFHGDEHAQRAARAAYRMRKRMHRIGRLNTPAGRVLLRMSVGIHSGTFHFVLVGDPEIHRELIVSGPAASRTAEMEALATADEIALSPETARLLDPSVLGEARGAAVLLDAEPRLEDRPPPAPQPLDGIDLATVLPPAIRAHLLSASGEPEHRNIAVAFVEFSGTDTLLTEQGPEALAAAIDQLVRNVQRSTAWHGATFFESDINRDGGKIMLTAGAPRSSGSDEDRLLRACRQIMDGQGTLPLRIGVNCGPVFAGDFGPSFRRTYSVKGDAINLAARVMGKARSGQILATLTVLERAASVFELEEVTPFLVKGKEQPINAAGVGALLGRRPRSGPATSALVGRGAELEQLRSALVRARSGHGVVVDLAGEAGIGKSRLVEEVLSATKLPTHVIRCDEYESTTPYRSMASLVRDVMGVAPDADGASIAAALRRTAEKYDTSLLPWLPLVADVLDVEMASTPEVDAVADAFRKNRTEEVTGALLGRLLSGPSVLVFDDVHLMDDASADLLESLCRGVEQHPWLVVVERRDSAEGFVPSTAYAALVIRPGRLAAGAARALVTAALQDTTLAPHAITALTERADGNPLFLQALALAARSGSSVDSLPITLEALITSEIDRLPPRDRTVLRFASVLGVYFNELSLRELLDAYGTPLAPRALARLASFVHQQGDDRYEFAHQLIRDTAYEGLAYRTRRDLHGRAGEILEAGSVDPVAVAELLSLHYFYAGRHEKAWYYSRLAGERASGKHAYAEAERLFARAVTVSAKLPGLDSNELVQVNTALGNARTRLGLQREALAAFRTARRGLHADPVGASLLLRREAEAVLRMGGHTPALRALSRGLRLLDGAGDKASSAARSRLEGFYAVVRENQGRHRNALRWARRAELHAEESGDELALGAALEAMHGVHLMLGRAPDRDYGQLALALYERLGDRAGQSRALNNCAVQSWIEGRGDEALAMFRRAEVVATEAGDTVGAAATRYNIGDVLVRLGRVDEAESLLRVLLPVLHGLGAEDFYASALRALGLALLDGRSAAEGRALLDQARALLDDLGESTEVVETDAAIVTGLLGEGRFEEAAQRAGAAATQARALDTGHLLAWLLRLQGAALADAGRLEEAETTLAQALMVADSQSRVERGFVLAELARLALLRANSAEAERLTRMSEDALDELGYVGVGRYRGRLSVAAQPRVLDEEHRDGEVAGERVVHPADRIDIDTEPGGPGSDGHDLAGLPVIAAVGQVDT